MSQNEISVLVVDDSAVVRGLMARAIESEPDIKLAGTAMHGQAAISFLQRQSVDVVVMDVEMPVMDGITALKRIVEEFPSVRVVMASGLTQQGAETSVQALNIGAVGCIGKPSASSMTASIAQVTDELVPLLRAVTAKKHSPAVTRTNGGASTGTSGETTVTGRGAGRSASPNRYGKPFRPSMVVIGTSTGGPKALKTVLTGLPVDFPLPILIVQHMPPMFTPMLAKHIAQDTGRPCIEGTNGGLIERGWTYVAPGDFHMEVTKRGDRMITTLNQSEPQHYCRPSVNPLFLTASEWYGNNLLGVMLTGMGEDGIEGTRQLVSRGGYMIAQDEASAVVWGMPGAVVREDLQHECLPLDQIAGAIQRLCMQEVTI
jgi:two-component system, chemotaxis family, protein-glutamate methylesterase/glutaminase